MNKQNTHIFTNLALSTKIQLCLLHRKEIGHNFCVDCLSYSLCSSCIIEKHAGHQVLGFSDREECKVETRELLLQTLEETLKDLKRRENEVKNRSTQVNLVKESLKKLLSQTLREISEIFKYLQEKITGVIEDQEKKLEKSLHQFYTEYNEMNDDMRQHLMKIMNCEINVADFEKKMIVRDPPRLPNFESPKDIFQKHRNVIRNAYQELNNAKNILINPKGNDPKSKANQIGRKIDKYLENSRAHEKVNESFMKTLNIIGKENAPILNLARLNKKQII